MSQFGNDEFSGLFRKCSKGKRKKNVGSIKHIGMMMMMMIRPVSVFSRHMGHKTNLFFVAQMPNTCREVS